jgi:hypothetical protein
VHRAIAALGGEVFIQWIPCDALNIVAVFSDFVEAFAWGDEMS